MQMHDMGNKPKELTAVGLSNQKSIYYPSLHLSENAPEEIMKKDVGDECSLHIMGKISSKSLSDGPGGKNKSIRIDIHKLGMKEKDHDDKMVERLKKRGKYS